MVSVAMVSVSEKLKQKKDQYSARGKYVWIATHTVKLKRLACSQENQESRLLSNDSKACDHHELFKF